MDLRISDIIQPRISHMKVVSKYVGKRVIIYPPIIKTYGRGTTKERNDISYWIFVEHEGPQNPLLPRALWNKQTKHGQQKIVIICVNKGGKEIILRK